jgi:hypothetical protein
MHAPNCALNTSPLATERNAVVEAAIETALKRFFNAFLNAFLSGYFETQNVSCAMRASLDTP